MNILVLNSQDRGGGAAEVARRLVSGYRENGQECSMVVGTRKEIDSKTIELPDRCGLSGLREAAASLSGRMRGAGRLGELFHCLGRPRRLLDRIRGLEDWNLPASADLLSLTGRQPDVIHAHNLHSFRGAMGHFDLSTLQTLSRRVPVVITLHDAWLTTGHCAFPTDCDRWRNGCGECPDIERYPPLLRDGTTENWDRKKHVYENSRLFIATPCEWLLERIRDSILATGMVEGRVIHNGLDLEVFHPGSKEEARSALDLPQDAHILLFAAQGAKDSSRKDFPTLKEAVARASETLDGRVIFVGLGEDAPPERFGKVEIRFIPYQNDPATVASYYRACDVFIHASSAETFPNTIIEAMACGRPVIATSVGGVPEQVSAETGYLVSVGDSGKMAHFIVSLLENDDKRMRFGSLAADRARKDFDLKKQTARYLSWFREIIDQRIS